MKLKADEYQLIITALENEKKTLEEDVKNGVCYVLDDGQADDEYQLYLEALEETPEEKLYTVSLELIIAKTGLRLRQVYDNANLEQYRTKMNAIYKLHRNLVSEFIYTGFFGDTAGFLKTVASFKTSPCKAGYRMAIDGIGLVYYDDIRACLVKHGVKKAENIEDIELFELYARLIGKAVERFCLAPIAETQGYKFNKNGLIRG